MFTSIDYDKDDLRHEDEEDNIRRVRDAAHHSHQARLTTRPHGCAGPATTPSESIDHPLPW